MSQSNQSPDTLLYTLGQNAAAVGHLANYLAALRIVEHAKAQELSYVALFDESKRVNALAQYGRLELIKEIQQHLEPFIKQHQQQYTR